MDLTCIHEASCVEYDKIYVLGVDISRAILFPVICQGRIGTYNFVVPGLSEPLF